MKKRLFALISMLLVPGLILAITIDGDMSDWTPGMQVDIQPNPVEEPDDFSAPELDIKDLYVSNDAEYLYIRLDINDNAIFDDLQENYGMMSTHEIFLDTDLDAGTGLTWGWWATGADYWILLNVPHGEGWVETWSGPGGWQEEIAIARFIGASGGDSQWEDTYFGCDVAINDDDNIMEIAIPLEAIGETAAMESTRILMYAENTADWLADTYPNDVGVESLIYQYNSNITVDGDLGDWTDGMLLDVNPNPEENAGDIVGYPELDMVDIFMTHDADNVYFQILVDGDLNTLDPATELVEIYLDTDADAGTGLTWGWWATGGDYYMSLSTEDHPVLEFAGTSGSDATFIETGFTGEVIVTADGSAYEVSIPRAAIGETALFETTNVFVYAAEMVTWGGDLFPDDIGGSVVQYAYGYGEGGEAPEPPDGEIIIDGLMGDWLPEWQFDVEPNPMEEANDYPDSQNLDMKDIYVYHDADFLYVRVDINDNGSFDNFETGQSMSIYLDTDMSNATGLTWGTWASGADYSIDISASGGIQMYNGIDGGWGWEFTGITSWLAGNELNNAKEVAIPLSALGELANGCNIAVVGQNNESAAWSHDSYPNDLDVETATYWFVPEGYYVDGNIGEWLPEDQLDVAPNPEEAAGDYGTADLDLKDIYVASDDDYLYFRVDMNDDGLLSNLGAGQSVVLYLDADMDVGTGLTWGWWATGADYLITISGSWYGILEYAGTGPDYVWNDNGLTANVAFSASGNIIEVGIARDILTNLGDGVNVAIGGHNSDWTADMYPDDLGGTTAGYTFPVDCTANGDVNGDMSTDILDVVIMVAHILGTEVLEDPCALIAGDTNEDGSIDILDVVIAVDWILNPARGSNAGRASVINRNGTVSYAADGYVGAFQLTLEHQDDIDIRLSPALIADFATEGNVTTVIIIDPAGSELFQAAGDFQIISTLAASTDGYIPVGSEIPTQFEMSPAYPNPFNPSTTFSYQIPEAGQVHAAVYDMQGRLVETLFSGLQDAGMHHLTWNAAETASGIYFIRLNAEKHSTAQKVLLVK